MIVCDTGPLVAAADRDDQHNRTCTDLLTGLHLARRAILVPAPVVAEVGYLLARARAAKVAAAFLRSIVQATLTVVDLELVDYERMAELVEIYADFPLGTTDAAVVAVAERLGVVEIATLDRLSAAHGGALAGHVGQVDGEGPGAVSGVGRQLRATCPKLLARVAAGAASVDAAAVGSSCSTSSRRTYAPLGSNLVLRATTSRPRPVFSLLSGSTIDK